MNLNILDTFPRELIDSPPQKWHDILGMPTLIHLKGEKSNPLFISVLLHGNEITGPLALQVLFDQYQIVKSPLPRDLIIFIGNTNAAKKGLRHLEGQVDFNRIWDLKATNNEYLQEHQLAKKVFNYLMKLKLFASVDIHNNSGKNPLYGCINQLDANFLHLASLFSQTVIYFTRPHEVLSSAMANLCPSLTVECGQSGDLYGVKHVAKYIKLLLEMKELDAHPDSFDINLFHTQGRLKVPKNANITFSDMPATSNLNDLIFIPELDRLNFCRLEPETLIARRTNQEVRLIFENNDGNDQTDEYFIHDKELILTKKILVPSMFTRDLLVIKQDCLGYIMDPMPILK